MNYVGDEKRTLVAIGAVRFEQLILFKSTSISFPSPSSDFCQDPSRAFFFVSLHVRLKI